MANPDQSTGPGSGQQPANPFPTLVLVGMMGSGKSTIGRKLAARLAMPFADADDEITAAAQMSVAEIFEKMGEDQFRDGERRVMARLIDGTPKVIATGGGAFMNEATRTLILTRARSIWLQADIDILVERVSRKDSRPLLAGGDPRAKLLELAALRDPVYALADVHVRSDAGHHDQTVDRIMEALRQ